MTRWWTCGLHTGRDRPSTTTRTNARTDTRATTRANTRAATRATTPASTRANDGAGVVAAVVLLVAASAALFAQTAEAPTLGATVTLDRPTLRIGERIGATLTLDGDADVVASRPALGQRIGDFEVLSVQATGLARLFGRAPRSWRLVLTSFEAGARSLDRVTIEGTTRDGRAFVSTAAPAVAVTVTSPTVRADDPLEPADPALPVPPPSAALVWGGRGLFTLGVLLLGWAIGRPQWQRLGARLERTRRWRRLHRTLDGVAARPAGDPVGARTHCDTVAAVLRQGSQYAAGRPLTDLSTTELVDAVAATTPGREVAPALAPVLSDLDALRFAGRAVETAAVTRSVDRAREVLRIAEAATRAEERRAS